MTAPPVGGLADGAFPTLGAVDGATGAPGVVSETAALSGTRSSGAACIVGVALPSLGASAFFPQATVKRSRPPTARTAGEGNRRSRVMRKSMGERMRGGEDAASGFRVSARDRNITPCPTLAGFPWVIPFAVVGRSSP